MTSDSMLRTALAVSALLHGLFGWWAQVHGVTQAPVFREIADSRTGPGIEVDAIAATAKPAAEPANTETSTNGDDAAGAHPAAATPERATARTEAPVATVTDTARTPQRPNPVHVAHTPPHANTTQAADERHAPGRVETAKIGASSKSSAGSVASEATAVAAGPSSTSPTGSDTATSGAFGAQGLPLGVRHLPKAFTRALSIADRSDPRWLTLPPGAAGEARVEIPVDEEGKLGELAYRDEAERERLLPVVRHLLENTRLLLESGHFSLDASALRAGVQRLRVRVEIVERAAAIDPDRDPNELRELEYEPPTATRPGRGSFALNSGRRVIGWVYLE